MLGRIYKLYAEEVNIETHREYFKNKVIIFCEDVPAGDYTFNIPLECEFSGTFTLNPAKAQLMYFPVFEGNNEIKRVRISD